MNTTTNLLMGIDLRYITTNRARLPLDKRGSAPAVPGRNHRVSEPKKRCFAESISASCV